MPQYHGGAAVPRGCHGSVAAYSVMGVTRECGSAMGVPWKRGSAAVPRECGSAMKVPWEYGSATVPWECQKSVAVPQCHEGVMEV